MITDTAVEVEATPEVVDATLVHVGRHGEGCECPETENEMIAKAYNVWRVMNAEKIKNVFGLELRELTGQERIADLTDAENIFADLLGIGYAAAQIWQEMNDPSPMPSLADLLGGILSGIDLDAVDLAD